MKALKYTAIVLALTSTVAMANDHSIIQTFAKPAAVGIEVGTLGYGANISWGVTDSVELQAGWNGSKISVDADIGKDDSVINWKEVLGDKYKDYQGNFKLEIKGDNPYIGTQIRPFKNAFTIGTGVIAPNQDIDATLAAVAGGSSKISINGKDYTLSAGDVIGIHAEPKTKLAPYLTLGFRPNIDSRFGLSAEIGAAYVGGYRSTVTVQGNAALLGTDIKQALENEIDGNSVKVYPIAKLGATLRF